MPTSTPSPSHPAARPGAGTSAVVGMVGAGQLARMTAPAAGALGIELVVLATSPEEPAARTASRVLIGDPDELDALRGLARACDVLTFDHEGVPGAHLEQLEAEGCVIRPGPGALRAAQDKLAGRRALAAAGFPLPRWEEVGSASEVEAFGDSHGWPVVLKTARGGYDGRGVWVAESSAEAAGLIGRGGEWIAEELVAIELEVSQLLARSPSGEVAVYPLVRTVQRDGICVEVVCPAGAGERIEDRAREIAIAIAEELGVTGVMAAEMFVAEGELSVNELAMRPHNSGHLSIEGCRTSQFENHLRAVLDWPLGSTELRAPAVVMTNVIGAGDDDPATRLPQALHVGDAHPHIYGKAPREGRKLGHVTALADSVDRAREWSREAATVLRGGLEP